MKKLLSLSLLFSLLFVSCNNDPDPDPNPEEIRAYCNIYHLITGLDGVYWEVDGVEVTNKHTYGSILPGSIILESESEEILFTFKHPVSGAVMDSYMLTLEKDKNYTIILIGTVADPQLLFQEVETSRPQSGQVKFQFLHAAPEEDSIDIYMGGNTPDKRVVTDVDFRERTDNFEVKDSDVRASIIVSIHDEAYNQDNVLLSAIYNEEVKPGASYLSILAPSTFDPESEFSFWLYDLPLE